MAIGRYFDDSNSRAILRAVQEDYEAARMTRVPLEERKLEHYNVYRGYRDELANGGKSKDDAGPFGWSKMNVPLAFWTVETTVPRLITRLPRPLVKPANMSAVPYLTAKSLRQERQFERARPMDPIVGALKQSSVFGDGPVKVTWNVAERRPVVTGIEWWYFWISPEATDYRTAECLFHMMWLSKRQLQALAKLKDSTGAPLYMNLEEVWDDAGSRDVEDPTWTTRREAAGMSATAGDRRRDSVPLLECWYDDGTRVVLGGSGFQTLVHARLSPYRCPKGKPIRPFVLFQNTPDIGMPYSIGDVEMIADYQREITTIRNQHVDQMTANIHAPIVHDENIPGNLINAALRAPGQRIPVPGDVTRAIMRLAPGQTSQDPVQLTDMVIGETQRATGISDYAAGQTSGIGLQNNTATGAQIAVQEGNKRWAYRQALAERGFREIHELVDAHDRRFTIEDVAVPLLGRDQVVAEGEGFRIAQGGTMAVVTAECNGWFLEPGTDPYLVENPPVYDLEVEEQSSAPPTPRERAQNVMAFLGLMGSAPMLAEQLDWGAVAREAVSAFGFNVDKMLVPAGNQEVAVGPMTPLSPEEEAQVQEGGDPHALAQAGGPAADQQAALAAAPEVPVGPPAPVDPMQAAAAMGAPMPMQMPMQMPPMPPMEPPQINLVLQPGAIQISPAEVMVHIADGAVQTHVQPPNVTVNGPGNRRIVYDDQGAPVGLEDVGEQPIDGEWTPEPSAGGEAL